MKVRTLPAPPPLRCWGCNRLGHSGANCKKKAFVPHRPPRVIAQSDDRVVMGLRIQSTSVAHRKRIALEIAARVGGINATRLWNAVACSDNEAREALAELVAEGELVASARFGFVLATKGDSRG